jgi:N,N-dimethylformamidase beta subunit-like, C-terminal
MGKPQIVRGEVSHIHNSKLNVSQIVSGNGTVQISKQPQSSISIISGLKESGRNGTIMTAKTSASLRLKTNETYYVFSKERSEISTPENNSHTGEFGSGVRIALVEPTFTAAAYNDGFYRFFNLYSNTPPGTNVTSNLKLLTSKVQDQNFTTTSTAATATTTGSSAFAMLKLIANLKWIAPESNVTVLTDADVDNGSIFTKNASNAFDVMILGHQEYVTQKEYDNLKHFVANGGTMIILDGNVFFVQVKYNQIAHTITLVKGHWWAFNGKSAWRSIGERWRNETSQWVGSNYLCYQCINAFSNDPFSYKPHEEQYITNPHDIILLNYNATGVHYKLSTPTSSKSIKHVIATYELKYQKGRVIAIGIYSEDIIANGKFNRYFDSLLLRYSPEFGV